MRLPIPFAVLALMAGLAACGDDGDSERAQPTTTAAAEATSTTRRRPSTATSTSCPAPGGDVVAAADLDGDGNDERFVSVGRGASVDIVEVRALVGCREVPVLLGDTPAQFAVGGTVTHLNGLRCDDGRLVELTAASDDGVEYATVDRSYELRDGALVLVDERTGSATGTDLEAARGTLDC